MSGVSGGVLFLHFPQRYFFHAESVDYDNTKNPLYLPKRLFVVILDFQSLIHAVLGQNFDNFSFRRSCSK